MEIRLYLPIFCFIFLAIHYYSSLFCQGHDSIRKGHLKPLGQSGPINDIDYYDGFPPMDIFFQDYVYKSKPLLMKAAATSSPAYKLWSDDYFLSFPEINDLQVMIEQPKDKNLTLKLKTGTFKEFLTRYKKTNEYLVDRVPSFFQ